ncbi:hypothetical protein Q604_UNBC10973G0001, partial [human gut metagenome]
SNLILVRPTVSRVKTLSGFLSN